MIKGILIKPFLLLGILILLLACTQKKQFTLPVVPITKQIEEHTLIKGNYRTVNFSPTGNYLQIPLPIREDLQYWNKALLYKDKKLLDYKVLINDTIPQESFIYDKLTKGNYKVAYTSYLNDTISADINFTESGRIELPDTLLNYYEQVPLKNLHIPNLKQGDTLQLFYKLTNCFGGNSKLFEFAYTDKNTILVRCKNLVDSFYEPIENFDYTPWKAAKNTLTKHTLDSLFVNIDPVDLEINFTISIICVLRVKGNNQISRLKNNFSLSDFVSDLMPEATNY